MLINRIKLKNVLSFGPNPQELTLNPLNVFIGPNGSGKSNVIEIVGLLQSAPTELMRPFRSSGTGYWVWQNGVDPIAAEVEVSLTDPVQPDPLRYSLRFVADGKRPHLKWESVEDDTFRQGRGQRYAYVDSDGEHTLLGYERDGKYTEEPGGPVSDMESALARERDCLVHPEICHVAAMFKNMRIYREWSFGRRAPARRPQSFDVNGDVLSEDGQNLVPVLNVLQKSPQAKRRIVNALQCLYEDVEDFAVVVEGEHMQVYLQEHEIAIPANRMSEGTLRFLCILSILCHPKPPPLVCIEEPELGLHPDILPRLCDLLREASERCQLIVTTHSDSIIDGLTDTPESVVVCERRDGQTILKRLDKDDLADWLERYSLGELWSRGQLGGNRW